MPPKALLAPPGKQPVAFEGGFAPDLLTEDVSPSHKEKPALKDQLQILFELKKFQLKTPRGWW